MLVIDLSAKLDQLRMEEGLCNEAVVRGSIPVEIDVDGAEPTRAIYDFTEVKLDGNGHVYLEAE